MRILVGKTFGIGNAILSIPMLKALKSLGHRVELLIGNTADDFGSQIIFSKCDFVDAIHTDPTKIDKPDLVIMAIPYDGRWDALGELWPGVQFVDERRRPGNVSRLGFDMWEKHEIEYQMENARLLGYSGPTPDTSFMHPGVQDADLVYVGLGYKRDPGGFGLSKHFGNERFTKLILEIRKLRPTVKFVSTGNLSDMMEVWYKIVQMIGPEYSSFYRFPLDAAYLPQSLQVLSRCGSYIGNDTGMMHAAASFGMPTCGLMAYPDLATKNPPFCERSRCIVFSAEQPDPSAVAQQFVDFVWG